ncbi:MAG TPA: hypothetical protein ENJ33_02790 [Thiothrix sp.]|nr:hypothetical protein [Thiothrix sp.]
MEVKVKTLKDMGGLAGDELALNIEVASPPPMMKVEELEEALQTNRQLLDGYYDGLLDHMRNDYIKQVPPWDLPYHSLLKNSVTARLMIDQLIPAINARGGRAKFTQLETKSAEKHIEILMGKADKTVKEEMGGKMIPMSTVIILIFLVACAVIGYLYLTNTNF